MLQPRLPSSFQNPDDLDPKVLTGLGQTLEADFRLFVSWFFWVQNGLKFKWNDHHDQICDALMECYEHRTQYLVINIPPRYSKTELVIIMFVAWCLARDGRCQFIHLSYSDELATDNSARIKDLIENEWYQALWGVQFKASSNQKSLWRTDEGGGMKAGAAGGPVIGFGAGIAYDIPEGGSPEDVPFGGAILIDDPMKADDAESDAERRRVNRRINSTVKSRKNAPWTPVILIMQRLHDDDMSGFVLNGGSGDTWEHLKIPVVRPNGEPLWPFRHTLEDLVKIQVADKMVWNGQYMQEPIPDSGDFFTADGARWYERLPEHLNFYGASDYAARDATGADFTEHGVFGVCPAGNVYLVDWWSGQTKTDVWIEQQLDFIAKYKTLIWGGETGPIKAAIEPWLHKRMKERKVLCPLRWISHSTANYKVANARPFQALWEQGRVYLPEGKEWAQDVLRQLTRFPLGTLDDKVDTCSIFGQLISRVWEQDPPKAEPVTPMLKGAVEINVADFYPKHTAEW